MTPKPESYATTMLDTERRSCASQPSQLEFKPIEIKAPAPTSTGFTVDAANFLSVRDAGVSSITVTYDAEAETQRLMHLRANGVLVGSAPATTNRT